MKMDSSNQRAALNSPTVFSTENVSVWQRREWLCEVIGREYANVEIKPSKNDRLYNEMNIYTWLDMRLSVIHSNAISIQRLPQEPSEISHDAYFAVILLAGEYLLEQNGREVFLKPGDITIYDATRPHRIHCPKSFSKLIVSIPRQLMHDKLPGVEHCTARKVDGGLGLGAIASGFVQSVANQANRLTISAFEATAEQSLDLFTLALNSIRPSTSTMGRSRSLSLRRVKDFVESQIDNSDLNTELIVNRTGLSARYINELFNEDGTSLMRHVWNLRLARCHHDLINANNRKKSISEIAIRWGFNDFSHFSRAFKSKYGVSPSALKNNSTLFQN